MKAEGRRQKAEVRRFRFLRVLLLTSAFCLLPSAFISAENRLSHEKSPYLLQHATNPIDWHPWSDEAFTKARKDNKPIFLSIGYSTCHWCHVMEKESFSDKTVGELLNASYVSIKVDREERPDIDSVYIAASRKLTGDAGWPLNVILTPDGKPFVAFSYLPKDRFMKAMESIAAKWRERPDAVLSSADLVMRSLQPGDVAADAGLDAATLKRAYEQLASRFDAENGGFLPEPKFPAAHHLMFLLRYWHRTGEKHALEMVETTLRTMRARPIYDAKNFGFHRYASDAAWREPHYEKMLYDQAMLAMAYLEAHQATGKREYANVAREIFTYVLRDLRAPNGAFYTAHDSDVRSRRDEKILTDWNGLMIAALSLGSVVLDEPKYAQAAKRAADAILPKARLQHQQGQPAYLDDYAFFVWGLLNLYEATFQLRYLESAIGLHDESTKLFRDAQGRFYITASDAESLLVRPRETGDTAMPSGNSVQLMNLVRLARMTAREDYAKQANELVRATADDVSLIPSTATHLLSALDFLLGPSFEIVLAGSSPEAMRKTVFARFVPNKVVIHRPRGDDPPIARLAPFTKEQRPLGKRTTAYVCTNYLCKLPTTDAAKVMELLQ
ncbi:MAG TPA: thioredoxin domain-containing protein [Thermoanaerobaculia bacterium]|nr:thioredoxin domain-containing protein [Thermoanaerobaculia bacterium]